MKSKSVYTKSGTLPILLSLLFFVVTLSFSTQVRAQEIMGADFEYSQVGKDANECGLFELQLILYYYCKDGSTSEKPQANINIFRGAELDTSFSLVKNSFEGEVLQPYCDSFNEATTCEDSSSPYPGIKKFAYRLANNNPIALCPDENWRITFTEEERGNTITNLDLDQINGGEDRFYIEANINSTVEHCQTGFGTCPNQVGFGTSPIGFYCSGEKINFEQGAKLNLITSYTRIYELVQPLANNGMLVPYIAGNSLNNPLKHTGDFQFDEKTGTITVTPVVGETQYAVVGIRMSEFNENGDFLGSTTRDVQLIVLGECEHRPIELLKPLHPIQNACVDETLDFIIQTVAVDNGDFDANNLALIHNIEEIFPADNLPVLTIDATTTNQLIARFEWTPRTGEQGDYQLLITATDGSCPLPYRFITVIDIHVDESEQTILQIPDNRPYYCLTNTEPFILYARGCPPFTWTSDLTIQDKSEDGDGSIVEVTPPEMASSTSIRVSNGSSTDQQTIDFLEGFDIEFEYDSIICRGETVAMSAIPSVGNLSDYVFTWEEDTDLDCLNCSEPSITVTNSRNYRVTISNGSECDLVKNIYIEVQEVNVDIGASLINACRGQNIRLDANGTFDEIEWIDENGSSLSNNGRQLDFMMDEDVTLRAQVQKNGCTAMAEVRLECDQEAKILIPNAFSPNGDGMNDVLSLCNPGNLSCSDIDFCIYNRWGSKVFITNSFKDGWDGHLYIGNLNKEAPVGTYTYSLTGQCNGKELKEQGMITLLR